MTATLAEIKKVLSAIEADAEDAKAGIQDLTDLTSKVSDAVALLRQRLEATDAPAGSYREVTTRLRLCSRQVFQLGITVELAISTSYFKHLAGWDTLAALAPKPPSVVFTVVPHGSPELSLSKQAPSSACESAPVDAFELKQQLSITAQLLGEESPTLVVTGTASASGSQLSLIKAEGPRLCGYQGKFDPISAYIFLVPQMDSIPRGFLGSVDAAIDDIWTSSLGKTFDLDQFSGGSLSADVLGLALGPFLSACCQIKGVKRTDRRRLPLLDAIGDADVAILIHQAAIETLVAGALAQVKQRPPAGVTINSISLKQVACNPRTQRLDIAATLECEGEAHGVSVTVRGVLALFGELRSYRPSVSAIVTGGDWLQKDIDVHGIAGWIPGLKDIIKGIADSVSNSVKGQQWRIDNIVSIPIARDINRIDIRPASIFIGILGR
jgi:hypothetical protein